MTLLATLWLPSLDPVGPASIVPAFIVFFLGLLSAEPLPRRWRALVLHISPPLLLLAAAVSPGSPIAGRGFPGLSAFLGYYLLIATGFGFSLSLLRHATKPARVLGYAAFFVFGGLIVFEVVLKSCGDLNLYYGGPAPGIAALVALSLFAVWGVSIVRRIDAYFTQKTRSTNGHCPACAYDLRGNPTGRACPECGAWLLHPRLPSVGGASRQSHVSG